MAERMEYNPVYGKIAQLAFLLYLFFVFFGTSLPFRPPVEAVDEKGTSNIINQVVFSSLFLLGVLSLWGRRDEAVALLKAEKWLTLLLFWCFLTLLWSDYPFVSFKRLFQICTTVVICLSALLWKDSSWDLIGSFRIIVYLYIVLSILSVFLVPGAIDPKSFTWRALAPSKNHLGQASLVTALFCFISMSAGGWKRKMTDGLMLILSLGLLMGARSLTAIMTLFSIALLWGILRLDDKFKTLGVGHFFLFFTVVTGIVFALVLAQFTGEIEAVLEFLGKDLTFTGRTDLWLAVFEETQKHLLLGAGFCGFWVVKNPAVLRIYQDFIWLPNQAHLGYLDLLNEIGLIGFTIFILMVFSYLRQFLRSSIDHPWIWFFLATLIINFQETTLFRQNVLTGVMFIFSYLALRYDVWRGNAASSARQ